MPLQIVLDRAESAAPLRDARYEEIEIPPKPQACGGHGRAAVMDALRRVLESHTFRHSQRHKAFLRHVVESVLDGRQEGLKEVVIGLEVFGRQLNGYDPDRDSIVRVEARRLRSKLQRYYAGEGAASAIEIRIPTGAYVAVFVTRPGASRAAAKRSCFLVLPLQMPNREEGERGLAIGLVDQIIERLGAHGGLRVMAPLAAAALREHPLEIDVLRRDHGIDYVIDGSITCHGGRIRCIAHLSRTVDRSRVWSGRFDFDAADDLFAFQDRIVDAVLAAAMLETKVA